MSWNWQLPDWPKFHYNPDIIAKQERDFLVGFGGIHAFLKNVDKKEYNQFLVAILSIEGEESARIEGEILDRESLQSSIRRHFGLQTTPSRDGEREEAMAELLCAVYDSFDQPLTHQVLWQWHSRLFAQIDQGVYRSHPEPMQIVSRRYGHPRVYFEAPPSAQVPNEMALFVDWFNAPLASEQLLGRTAIAHVYFESIHPFEDGNGRIGRALVEKLLSRSLGRPTLIAVSKVLETRKKEYYAALEACNRSLDAGRWVEFFADAVLQAQADSIRLLSFLIKKSKMLTAFSGQINARQEKALVRMFAEGPSEFKGGLSAEKYIAITKASRATATRDLVELVQKGALIKTGELRHTRYWLNIDPAP